MTLWVSTPLFSKLSCMAFGASFVVPYLSSRIFVDRLWREMKIREVFLLACLALP